MTELTERWGWRKVDEGKGRNELEEGVEGWRVLRKQELVRGWGSKL